MTAHNGVSVRQWAQNLVDAQAARTRHALDDLKERPDSTKRVHAARKELARFEAACADLDSLVAQDDTLATDAPALHRAAGKVRNADVACKRLAAYESKANGAECDEIARLRRKLKKRRKRAVQKFFSKPAENAPAKVQPRAIDLSSCKDADAVIAEILRVRAAEMLHCAPALRGSNDESLHVFRLHCKQLRYGLQRFDAKRLGLVRVEAFLTELVDALGAAHDCSAVRRRALKHHCALVARRAATERAQHLEDATWIWLSGSRIGGELEALAAYVGFSAAPVHA